jgi:hypothetical protein
MFTSTNRPLAPLTSPQRKLWGTFFVLASLAFPQDVDIARSLKVELPSDAPVAFASLDTGDSRATPRGSALVLDLHASLTLRNVGTQRIRGITLLIAAQEVTPGGKASVSVPSLDIAAGDTFSVRLDLRLLRPSFNGGSGPLVQVTLDGVLFDSLAFYGPNKLNSRRAMTTWELEARRDRKFFAAALANGGIEGLRQAAITALARIDARPRLDVQVARGRVTAYDPSREVQFAFVKFPESPIESVKGSAAVTATEIHSPKLELRNTSQKPVKYIEMGWILADNTGKEVFASAVPAKVNLAPGQSGQVLEDTQLKVARPEGRPLNVTAMKGYLSSVEFTDGEVWIPTRQDLSRTQLDTLAAPSAEEERLLGIYRKKGLPALITELKKFQ